jgi:hypothetical protein
MTKATEPNTTSPSRRALLAGAPVAAAAALAGGTVANAVAIGMAKAAEVDPIFAAIERHREAVRVHEEAMAHFRALAVNDRPMPFLETVEERTDWVRQEMEQRRGTPRDIAYKAWCAASDVVGEATTRLLDTRSTTLASAVAALEYWAEFMEFTFDDDNHDYDFLDTDIHSVFVTNIAVALRDIIERGQA